MKKSLLLFVALMLGSLSMMAQAVGDEITYGSAKYTIKGENLISNGNFADGTFDGWTQANDFATTLSASSFSISNDTEKGNYLVGTTNSGSTGTGSIGTAWSIEAGKTYYFKYDVYSLTGSTGTTYLKSSLTNNKGKEESVLGTPTVTANAWSTYEVVFTNSDNYAYAQVMFRWLNSQFGFTNFGLYEVEESSIDLTAYNAEIATAEAQLATYTEGTDWYTSLNEAIAAAKATTPTTAEEAATAVSTLQAAEKAAAAAYKKSTYATIEAGTYYIKNNEAGQFLANGAYWGTRSVLFGEGLTYEVTVGEDGKYTLASGIKNATNALRPSDGYNDQSGTWEIYPTDGGVLLYNGSKYFSHVEGSMIPDYVSEPTAGSVWTFVTPAERKAAISEATQENPVDATAYITAADFHNSDVDNAAWDGYKVGGDNGSGSTLLNNANSEKWNAGTYVVSQTISDLPNGTYTLTAQAFYRHGGTGAGSADAYEAGTEVPSKLFANNDSVVIKSVYSEAPTDAANGGWSNSSASTAGVTYYIPNGQNTAAACFNAGAYVNTIENIEVTDGTLKIGVARTGDAVYDWTVFDSFRLTCYGSQTPRADLLAYANDVDAALPLIDDVPSYKREAFEAACAAIKAAKEVAANRAATAEEIAAAKTAIEEAQAAYEAAAAPSIVVTPAEGEVESISEITLAMTDGSMIAPSGQDLTVNIYSKTDRTIVATFDQDALTAGVQLDEETYMPYAIKLTLAEPVSAAGSYDLVIPAGALYVSNDYVENEATTVTWTIPEPPVLVKKYKATYVSYPGYETDYPNYTDETLNITEGFETTVEYYSDSTYVIKNWLNQEGYDLTLTFDGSDNVNTVNGYTSSPTWAYYSADNYAWLYQDGYSYKYSVDDIDYIYLSLWTDTYANYNLKIEEISIDPSEGIAFTSDPADGATVESISKITFTFTGAQEAADYDQTGTYTATITDAAGNSASSLILMGWGTEMNQVTVECVPITTPGTYTVTLPAGSVLIDNVATTEDVKITLTIPGETPSIDIAGTWYEQTTGMYYGSDWEDFSLTNNEVTVAVDGTTATFTGLLGDTNNPLIATIDGTTLTFTKGQTIAYGEYDWEMGAEDADGAEADLVGTISEDGTTITLDGINIFYSGYSYMYNTQVTLTRDKAVEPEPEPSDVIDFADAIIVLGEQAMTVAPCTDKADISKWYLLKQKRGGVTPAYDNGENKTLMRAATDCVVDGANAADYAQYLVRFIPTENEGAYNIQFGTGRYFGTTMIASTTPGEYNVYNINGEDGHIGINLYDMGSIVDNNAAGYTLAFWGTGEVTSLNGNNDWTIWDVTVKVPSQEEKDQLARNAAMDSLLAVVKAAYSANTTYDYSEGLITSSDQFSSPYTETSEGSLENLLDGDSSTFWHSNWSDGSVADGTHYLEIALPENTTGTIELDFTRRNVTSDQLTKADIVGVDADGNTTVIATIELPYGAKSETVKATFTLDQAYSSIRIVEQATTGGSGFWHVGDLQLYQISVSEDCYNAQNPAVAADLAAAIETAEAVENASQADIDALQAAYDAYLVGDPVFDYVYESYVGSYYEGATVDIETSFILDAIGAADMSNVTVYSEEPDGTRTASVRGNTDGWRDATGKFVSWGADAYFYVQDNSELPGAQYYVGGYPGKTDEPCSFTATLVYVNNDTQAEKAITITLKYVEAPAIELTVVDTVEVAVSYAYGTGSYTEQIVSLTDAQLSTVLTDLGISALSESYVYGYNPTTGEYLASYASYDGWRDANGDFANWTGDATTVPFCAKVYDDGLNYYCYNLAEAWQSGTMYFAIANEEDKAVMVKIVWTTTDVPTSINGVDANENATIYNLNGVKLNKMQRGINIVNGVKVIKK